MLQKKIGNPNCLIIAKTYLQRWFKYFGNVFMCPKKLYPKSYFNNLSKLKLFNTSLVMKRWLNKFSFQIRIQMEDIMKCIKILII
jgi:hypothetical protein